MVKKKDKQLTSYEIQWLSPFYGSSGKGFYGGKYVESLKKCENFWCKVCVGCDSWTSGLIASVGSLDINPGDEIIVSPWSMCASATSILWNAIQCLQHRI